MKSIDLKKDDTQSEERKLVETYYKKTMRMLEYYVLGCFVLITFVPLLNFSWIPAFVKLVYFTGFPLLILIFIISLFKEPVQNLLTNIISK
jgi:hypothetical protein